VGRKNGTATRNGTLSALKSMQMKLNTSALGLTLVTLIGCLQCRYMQKWYTDHGVPTRALRTLSSLIGWLRNQRNVGNKWNVYRVFMKCRNSRRKFAVFPEQTQNVNEMLLELIIPFDWRNRGSIVHRLTHKIIPYTCVK
jgi:hypothetical protein